MKCAGHSKHGNSYCRCCAAPGTAGLLDAAVERLRRQERCSGTQSEFAAGRTNGKLCDFYRWQSSHGTLTSFLLMSEHKLSILGTIVHTSNSTHPGELSLYLLRHPERLTHCGCLPPRTSQVQQDDAISHTSATSADAGVHTITSPSQTLEN